MNPSQPSETESVPIGSKSVVGAETPVAGVEQAFVSWGPMTEADRRHVERLASRIVELERVPEDYESELDRADKLAADCEKEGDRYGWNFHQGRRSGIIEGNIIEAKAKAELTADLSTARAEVEAGARFKAFVHHYLDTHGVPAGDPTNQHQKEGCRIGARLDLLLAERDQLRAEVEALTKERDEAQVDARTQMVLVGHMEIARDHLRAELQSAKEACQNMRKEHAHLVLIYSKAVGVVGMLDDEDYFSLPDAIQRKLTAANAENARLTSKLAEMEGEIKRTREMLGLEDDDKLPEAADFLLQKADSLINERDSLRQELEKLRGEG